MDEKTIRALAELNNEFYRENHASFSESRHASWPGWKRVCASMPLERRPCRVLDVASGNMRFERFMLDEFPDAELVFTCIDACEELVRDVGMIRFVAHDVIDALLDDAVLLDDSDCGFDTAVSFGFMHHVPSAKLRESFMRALAMMVRPGGTVTFSFWRFMDDPRLAAQARRKTEEHREAFALELEPGDYFLGWNGREGVYRYCHHFTGGEIDALADGLSGVCEVVDRFSADGRNDALNGYLVLRRR